MGEDRGWKRSGWIILGVAAMLNVAPAYAFSAALPSIKFLAFSPSSRIFPTRTGERFLDLGSASYGSNSNRRTPSIPWHMASTTASAPSAETRLLELVQSTKGRGQSATPSQLQEIQEAITDLEGIKGVDEPIMSPLICGSWELLYTSKSQFDIRNPLGKRVDGSKPGIEGFFGAIFGDDSKATQVLTNAASSSPIQRTVTSIDGVLVSQDITLGVRDPRVDQRVTLNKDAYLRLSASASTNTASNSRINFTFDLAYFQLGPLRIPYPVPFRLLGDEAKGWIDTTYLSARLRISRGNKGTTFIFRRLE